MRRSGRGAWLLLAGLAPSGAAALAPGQIGLVAAQADGPDAMVVELARIGSDRADMSVPARLPADLTSGDRRIGIVLERAADGAGETLRYRVPLPPERPPGMLLLAIPTLGISGIALRTVSVATSPAVTPAAAGGVSAPTGSPTFVAIGRNAFFDRFAPYRGVYAVYGPRTQTAARIQLSFQFRPFGRATGSWLDGVGFGYTQRILWDIEARSAPIRDVNYMPELFYEPRPWALGNRVSLAGRGGLAHESNGRGGDASRSVNMAYLQPEVTLPVGGWTLTAGPRVWAYLGSRIGNPDIGRYRGNAGLHLSVGQADGFQLVTDSRLNPGSGKGAIEAEASYPLDTLLSPDINLYLFVQGFAGYGESLLDYDRRQTRLRVGLGFAR